MAHEDRVKLYYSLFSERKLKELEALFTDDSLIIDFRGTEGNDLYVFYGEKIRVLKTTLPPG